MSQVMIIRTDGAVEEYQLKTKGVALLRWIHRAIAAETTDSVNLRDGRVLICDDTGWECEMIDHGKGHFEAKPIRNLKPINRKATELYHSVCQPGTTHQIAGDVAVAWDEDFA